MQTLGICLQRLSKLLQRLWQERQEVAVLRIRRMLQLLAQRVMQHGVKCRAVVVGLLPCRLIEVVALWIFVYSYVAVIGRLLEHCCSRWAAGYDL